LHKKAATKSDNCNMYCGEKYRENEYVYQCWQCGFNCCEECFKYSLSKNETKHEHPLKPRYNKEAFTCSKCNTERSTAQFACKTCDFKLCLKCKFE
jgi:hypothetical protein